MPSCRGPLRVSGFDSAGGTYIRAATQIGWRLFVSGSFASLTPPLGGAVVLDPTGAVVLGAFPTFTGGRAADRRGRPRRMVRLGRLHQRPRRDASRGSRVRPDRHVDPAFTGDVDDIIGLDAVAHGRIYLARTFRFRQ
jgi:hypothetical protein